MMSANVRSGKELRNRFFFWRWQERISAGNDAIPTVRPTRTGSAKYEGVPGRGKKRWKKNAGLRRHRRRIALVGLEAKSGGVSRRVDHRKSGGRVMGGRAVLDLLANVPIGVAQHKGVLSEQASKGPPPAREQDSEVMSLMDQFSDLNGVAFETISEEYVASGRIMGIECVEVGHGESSPSDEGRKSIGTTGLSTAARRSFHPTGESRRLFPVALSCQSLLFRFFSPMISPTAQKKGRFQKAAFGGKRGEWATPFAGRRATGGRTPGTPGSPRRALAGNCRPSVRCGRP